MKNATRVKVFALIVLLSNYLSSQNVQFFWGKAFPLDHKGTNYLLGKTDKSLIGYKVSRKTVSTTKYSLKDLLLAGENPIIGSKKSGSNVIDNDYTLNSFVITKSNMFVSVTNYDRKADKNSIYMQQLDDAGKLSGKFTKVDEISATRKNNSGSFDIYTSDDSTKVLLVNNPPYERYSGEKFGFKIFDENLKEIKNLKIELPYKDRYFSVESYVLANDGTIFMLARINLSKKERKEKEKDESTYYYEIISINTEGKGEVAEYEINLKGKFIEDVSFSYDEDQKKIICAGFYGNLEKRTNGINGIFFMRIDKASKNVEATGFKELDKDFVADLTSKRSAAKEKGISSLFNIKKFVRKSDGGAVLIAEYTYDYTVTTCTTDPKTGARSCTTTYHYVRNNILAINIAQDGTIKWLTNIPKYQHTVNDGGAYNSFLFSTFNDKMYFIYNDNAANLDPTKVKTVKDIRTMSNPKKSTCVLVELNEGGEFSKKAIFNSKENKFILMPKFASRVGEHEYIVESISPGFYCCIIPFKKALGRMARITFTN